MVNRIPHHLPPSLCIHLTLFHRRLPSTRIAIDYIEIRPLPTRSLAPTSSRVSPSIPLLPSKRLPRCCSRAIHLPSDRPGSGTSHHPPSLRQGCRTSLYPCTRYFDQSMEWTYRTSRPKGPATSQASVLDFCPTSYPIRQGQDPYDYRTIYFQGSGIAQAVSPPTDCCRSAIRKLGKRPVCQVVQVHREPSSQWPGG
jgi:hypothetical protein